MDKNVSYYRRRLAEEQAAERSAKHPGVRAAHHDLARVYEERIAALDGHGRPPHLRSVEVA